MNYIFSSSTKKYLLGLIVVGLVMLLIGASSFSFDPSAADVHVGWEGKIWSNLLTNSVFFFGISLIAVFFIALQYVAESGWSTVLKRIFEGVSTWLPIASVLVFVAVAYGVIKGVYHWAHYNHQHLSFGDEGFDHLLDKKSAVLNNPVIIGGCLVILLVYVMFQRSFMKRTDVEDQEGGVEQHKKNITASAAFIVIFGFTSVILIWMVLMSIDAHWFSTMYGWYVFSGMWISFITMTLMIIYQMKSKGYLEFVTKAHLHDMGKWMFAVSFLWSYLFFCQFMLIWYANVPEEVTYYIARIEDYNFLFFGMFVVNFVLPMILLMDKDAKVNKNIITMVGFVILFGHFVDSWLLVTPGVMKGYGDFGLFELGMFLTFLGIFLYFVMGNIAKKPLIVKNHPFLDESKHLGH